MIAVHPDASSDLMCSSQVGNPDAGQTPGLRVWFLTTARKCPAQGNIAVMTAVDRGCAKTAAFNLRVESSSRFSQSENQKCWRRLPEEGNRENGSTVSSLAHVFTRVRRETGKE